MRPRLIDLHCDWLLQYANESTTFDPACYPGVASRHSQAAGYLQETSASIFSCYRRAAEWAHRPDPWSSLADLVCRLEAEFPGRLLRDAVDVLNWQNEPESLCFGMIGVEGFDSVIRTDGHLTRLATLFRRGVRLFQPVYTSTSELAGSSAKDDTRGLLPLGRAFLEALVDTAPELEYRGSRPILDLAHMNPTAVSDVLDWFEADSTRPRQLILTYSHGAVLHPEFDAPRALTHESLVRLRALGGVVGLCVGPPFYASKDALRAGIEAVAATPFLGREGYEGIAIGTDFLGVDQTAPGLGNATEVGDWVAVTFDPDGAAAILHGNARRLIVRSLGGDPTS